MEPYRKKVNLPTGSDYWFVEMGPIPNMPDCHQRLYQASSYAFPSRAAAELFARTHTSRDPDRDVKIRRGK